MENTKSSNYFSSIILLLFVILFWAFFAPSQIGGKANYVIVEGISMLPTFHAGDLVIARSSPSYNVGDIITYKQPELGIYIIHRVVGMDNGAYITKGDNVSTPDAYQPRPQDIIGKAWLHLPLAGKFASSLKTPIFFSLTVGALALLFFPLMRKPPPVTVKRNKGMQILTPSSTELMNTNPKIPKGIEYIIPALSVILVIILVAFIWLIMTPFYIQGNPLRYYQAGQFSYSTNTASGIYDFGSAKTGDPIFTKITCTMNLSYAYALTGDSPSNVTGTYALYMQITDPNSGWKKTVPLDGPTAFTGQSIRLDTSIDMCQVINLMQQYEAETGTRQGTYLFNIIALVDTTGLLENVTFQGSFPATLRFIFDRSNFYVDQSDPEIDPYQSNNEAMVVNPTMRPNTVSILGIPIRVSYASMLSLLLGMIVATALVYLINLMNRVMEEDIESRVRILYGVLIVDASDIILKLAPIIEFDSIDQLAKLASNQNTAILRTYYLNCMYYTLRIGDISYRYIQENPKIETKGG